VNGAPRIVALTARWLQHESTQTNRAKRQLARLLAWNVFIIQEAPFPPLQHLGTDATAARTVQRAPVRLLLRDVLRRAQSVLRDVYLHYTLCNRANTVSSHFCRMRTSIGMCARPAVSIDTPPFAYRQLGMYGRTGSASSPAWYVCLPPRLYHDAAACAGRLAAAPDERHAVPQVCRRRRLRGALQERKGRCHLSPRRPQGQGLRLRAGRASPHARQVLR